MIFLPHFLINLLFINEIWALLQDWYISNNLKKISINKNKMIEFFDNKLDQEGDNNIYYYGISFKNTEEDIIKQNQSKEAKILNV